MKNLIKMILYQLWVLYGYLGWHVSGVPEKVTVLITYYKPARLKHINHTIRNLLKCQFIETIVISNHNPAFQIEEYVTVKDPRLVFVNQLVRQPVGFRWKVSCGFYFQYLIVMDDDVLPFPWQVRSLFSALLAEPEIPHGFAGMAYQPDSSLEYYQRQDRQVDYLCEIYAITYQHLTCYHELQDSITHDPDLETIVNQQCDFVVMSRTGSQKPKIHNAVHLQRCPTFNQAGVAVHREEHFWHNVQVVASTLDAVMK